MRLLTHMHSSHTRALVLTVVFFSAQKAQTACSLQVVEGPEAGARAFRRPLSLKQVKSCCMWDKPPAKGVWKVAGRKESNFICCWGCLEGAAPALTFLQHQNCLCCFVLVGLGACKVSRVPSAVAGPLEKAQCPQQGASQEREDASCHKQWASTGADLKLMLGLQPPSPTLGQCLWLSLSLCIFDDQEPAQLLKNHYVR